MKKWQIPRRTFLKGLGTALALPMLDAMVPARAAVARTPLRMAFLYGSGIADGNTHSHQDLPVLLAGRGGGAFQTGRHVQFPTNTPMTNLYLAMLERMGVTAERLGDSTGVLKGLG